MQADWIVVLPDRDGKEGMEYMAPNLSQLQLCSNKVGVKYPPIFTLSLLPYFYFVSSFTESITTNANTL